MKDLLAEKEKNKERRLPKLLLEKIIQYVLN